MRQIKATIRHGREKGKLILYKPDELAHSAIVIAMKAKNTKETIWWALKKTVVVTKSSFNQTVDHTNPKKPQKGWHAFAEGTVMLGKTDVKTDKFFDAKKYNFKLEYKTSKDDLGLPDIEVVSADLKLADPHGHASFANISLKNIPPLSAKAMTPEKFLAASASGKLSAPNPVKSAPQKPVPFETKATAPSPEPAKK